MSWRARDSRNWLDWLMPETDGHSAFVILFRLKPFYLLALTGTIVSVVVGCTTISSPNSSKNDSGFYYYYHNERIQIRPLSDRLAIRFAPYTTEQDRMAVLSKLDVDLFSQVEAFELYIVRHKRGALGKSDLRKISSIEQVIEVFVWEDGTMFLIPNQFFAQFQESVSEKEIIAFNQQYGVTIVEKNEWLGKNYLLQVPWDSELSALDLANLYHKDPITEFATPNFVRLDQLP
jgi:hypothetical protein